MKKMFTWNRVGEINVGILKELKLMVPLDIIVGFIDTMVSLNQLTVGLP